MAADLPAAPAPRARGAGKEALRPGAREAPARGWHGEGDEPAGGAGNRVRAADRALPGRLPSRTRTPSPSSPRPLPAATAIPSGRSSAAAVKLPTSSPRTSSTTAGAAPPSPTRCGAGHRHRRGRRQVGPHLHGPVHLRSPRPGRRAPQAPARDHAQQQRRLIGATTRSGQVLGYGYWRLFPEPEKVRGRIELQLWIDEPWQADRWDTDGTTVSFPAPLRTPGALTAHRVGRTAGPGREPRLALCAARAVTGGGCRFRRGSERG